MAYILLVPKRCPGCNQGVDSTTGSETWHDQCWRDHRDSGCTSHDLCKRALKEGW